jgi:hypothetical protein
VARQINTCLLPLLLMLLLLLLLSCRHHLPGTPQHCIALLLLLHELHDPRAAKLKPAVPEDKQVNLQERQQQQQQQQELAAAWPQLKQSQADDVAAACRTRDSSSWAGSRGSGVAEDAAADVAGGNGDQQLQRPAAAALLKYLQGQLAGSSKNSSLGATDAAAQAPEQAQQVLLPTQVAAAVAASITASSDSSEAAACDSLRCCLVSMGAAALQQLKERGRR